MKIAIVVTGEYRTFAYCRKTWNFLDQKIPGLDIDVFFTTWNVTRTENLLKSETEIKKVPVVEAEIAQVLNRPAVIKVNEFNFPNEYGWGIMRRGWLLGMELLEKSGVRYDYVYVTRPDLFYRKALFDINSFGRYENAVGFGQPPKLESNGYICQDTAFFSTYNNIKKILGKDILDFEKNYPGKELHHVWYTHIKDNGLDFEEFPFMNSEHTIARYPISHEDNFDKVFDNFWYFFRKFNNMNQ